MGKIATLLPINPAKKSFNQNSRRGSGMPSEKTSLSPKSGHPYNQAITRPINFTIVADMPGDTTLVQGASPILTYNPPPQW